MTNTVRFTIDGYRFHVTPNKTRVYAREGNTERAVSPQKRTAMIRKYSDTINEVRTASF